MSVQEELKHCFHEVANARYANFLATGKQFCGMKYVLTLKVGQKGNRLSAPYG